MSRAGYWARRAMLSALAGGGLTAAGVGGPVAGGALATEAASGASASEPAPTSTAPEAAPTQTQTQTQPATAPSTATTTTTAEAPPPPTTTAAPTPAPSGTSQQPSSAKPQPTSSQDQAPSLPTAKRHKQRPSTGGTAAPQLPLAPAPAHSAPAPQGPAIAPSANIAPAPALAAGQVVAAPALLSGSLVSMQALGFYRIPLFLLPIYHAAAAQYGVPWQILAAINEVETDYGSDLSVSSAGAVGWMQFMPETWLQYGVDAVNAGYADPYNPVDAIFAAARYLRAAGAASDLHAAILAYNHSEAYVQSVMLRARLISSYPESVIDTLTGLTEGGLPVHGGRLLASPQESATSQAPGGEGPSSATAGAAAQPGAAAASAASVLPGSSPAPAPQLSAAAAEKLANAPSAASQLSQLIAPKDAPVVAVEDGRIVSLGRSRKLGNYLVLRDTYGDVFTYAGLGSLVPSYHLPKAPQLKVPTGALRGGEGAASAATQAQGSAGPAGDKGNGAPSSAPEASPATKAAGGQAPLTLHVASRQAPKRPAAHRQVHVAAPAGEEEGGKVRVFARPGNPDALIAAAHRQAAPAKSPVPGSGLARGSLVAQGTVLGHLAPSEKDPKHSFLRFAIRPAGAQSAIDPGPVLDNWRQLGAALHPQGAKGSSVLAGATAGQAFLLAGPELERAVLSDPGIRLSDCDRRQVAAGKADSRALALLLFLSRSGLEPTVGELRCSATAYAGHGPRSSRHGDALTITAFNGVAVEGHQGAGTISDIAIRTLLTVKRPFAPQRILSLMQYPGVPSTVAQGDHASYIELQLAPRPRHGALARASSTGSGSARRAAASTVLDTAQWRKLIARIGTLPQPAVARKPSTAAIRDPNPSKG